jgi:hypothetical protein
MPAINHMTNEEERLILRKCLESGESLIVAAFLARA